MLLDSETILQYKYSVCKKRYEESMIDSSIFFLRFSSTMSIWYRPLHIRQYIRIFSYKNFVIQYFLFCSSLSFSNSSIFGRNRLCFSPFYSSLFCGSFTFLANSISFSSLPLLQIFSIYLGKCTQI